MAMVQGSERPASWAHAISLRQLRFFTTLAQAGNFSRAAEEMAISQPALSAGIRQIESHLGLRLFDRTTHRVSLTEMGRALLPHAQRLLTTADNAFIDMRDAASREGATVRIGAIPSAVAAVAAVLAALASEMSGVSAHLHDGKSDDLIKGLRKGAYDMVITVPAGPESDLGAMSLFDDEMLLVTRADHPLAAHERLPWRALVGQEILHFAGGSIGDLASAAMQQNGLAPSGRYCVDQVDSLYGLVLSGLAVGVMPRLYTRGTRDERLSLTPLERPIVRRRLKLLHRSQLRDEHPLAASFATRFGSELHQALAG